MLKRSSGVLLHISSLPGPFGIGTLGNQAREFAEMLAKMGCSYWQILPINHSAEGNSPYASRSLFAINPNFIDLYALQDMGFLNADEIGDVHVQPGQKANEFSIMEKKRLILLRKAYSRIDGETLLKVKAFAEKQASWLDAYALFIVLKNNFGDISWNEWPVIGLRLHKADAIAQAYIEYENDILFWKFIQYIAYSQWADFRKYVNGLGIGIFGDMPIYAAFDSSDVWADNCQFQLNTKHIPKRVAGVPPDYFNKNGQLWGNPLYNWSEMKKDGYSWWLKRIENALSIYDIVRIDHFRGLYAYWAVPFANKTAKKGEWLKGPGMDLIRKIRARFPDMPFIMEDLGSLDRHVKKFFETAGYPGMRVMQFGFGADGDPMHLPENYPEECVAYTGTHDNNTILGWYDDVSELTKADSMKELGFPPPSPENPISDKELCRAWIENLFASKAGLIVVPIQDLLYEGAEARMNFPGTASPINWLYRVDERKYNSLLDIEWIAELNAKHGRAPEKRVGGADAAKTAGAAKAKTAGAAKSAKGAGTATKGVAKAEASGTAKTNDTGAATVKKGAAAAMGKTPGSANSEKGAKKAKTTAKGKDGPTPDVSAGKRKPRGKRTP